MGKVSRVFIGASVHADGHNALPAQRIDLAIGVVCCRFTVYCLPSGLSESTGIFP